MKRMTEPFTTIFTAKGLVALSGFVLAAFANATLEVKKNGWKGIWSFIGNVVIAVSAGQIIYSFLLVGQPEYALSLGFAAAYIGPSAIKLLWNSFAKTINPVK